MSFMILTVHSWRIKKHENSLYIYLHVQSHGIQFRAHMNDPWQIESIGLSGVVFDTTTVKVGEGSDKSFLDWLNYLLQKRGQ